MKRIFAEQGQDEEFSDSRSGERSMGGIPQILLLNGEKARIYSNAEPRMKGAESSFLTANLRLV
ncbi:hypothetical protein SBV1_1520016 [Verrucomicrobia bacterium]|nr:hypothetical protein SBV1_1520016 [Verrucomicrobiota bacterium]